jgi:dipeptidyl aminopeptidase/acylaminoacyl peptidase
MIRRILAVAILVLAPAPAPGQETHPFTVHDLVAMDRISDPQVSPDATMVAFVLRKTDLDANRGRTDIWTVRIDGTDLRRLTSNPASESNPRWSPDGKWIYFLSARGDSSQVWRIPTDGGEAEQVTHQPLDISAFNLSNNGHKLAIAMEVYPRTSIAETRSRDEEKAKSKATGRIYDRLMFRHWDTWKDGKRSHIFVVPVWGGGEAVDVMPLMDADSPTKPFGGPEEFTFAPDDESVVFTAKVADRDEAWTTNHDLFAVPADGSSPPMPLTAANKAWDTNPVFSPLGRLAYLAMARPGYEADRYQIIVKASPAANSLSVTKEWDRSPGAIAWSADESAIYAVAANLGQQSLFEVNVATTSVRTIHQDGYISTVKVAGDRLLILMDTLRSPAELFTIKPDGSELFQITDINAEKVAATRMGDYEQFTFKGWRDETVYGYVVKPVDFDAGKKYPVAFLIHGGPQGSFGNHWHYRWNPQTYAGAGYAAVMIDFHGSTGYGQAFTDSIRGDWGGKPLEDLQKGLAAALEKYSWLDGDRVAALGASYGGYMINWIAGNWPDRFKCLVCHDGNLCERLAYYDTEELWFPEWDHVGTPWENPENYEKHNPINHVMNWKTPMLVIHGALDYRVVDTQGMSTFTALQRRGIPSKFLYFPDENHWVLKPANSILWHETVIGWLDEWTKK